MATQRSAGGGGGNLSDGGSGSDTERSSVESMSRRGSQPSSVEVVSTGRRSPLARSPQSVPRFRKRVALLWATVAIIFGAAVLLNSSPPNAPTVLQHRTGEFSGAGGQRLDAASRRSVMESYDSALSMVDDKVPLMSRNAFKDSVDLLEHADFPDIHVSAKEAVVVLREVLRHQAPLLRIAGRNNGLWISSADTLHRRILAASSQFGRACLRKDIVLVGCSIASLEARFLQEWVTWHIFVAGFTHLVIYHNIDAGSGSDNTAEVLKPFIDAGFVTLLPWAPGVHYDVKEEDAQGAAYHQCTQRLKAVSCRYEHGNPFEPSQHVCTPRELSEANADGGRSMWAAVIDIDEFLAVRDPSLCVTDVLRQFSNEAGLAVHWRVFGHSGHLMAPRGALVTETYTRRIPSNTLNNHVKTIANLRFVTEFRHPHIAQYSGGRVAVNEFRVPVNVPIVPNPPAENQQGIVLLHFQPRSIEDGVMKWVRGRASVKGSYGGRIRDPGHLPSYFRDGLNSENVEDPIALPGAAMVRAILKPTVHPIAEPYGEGGSSAAASAGGGDQPSSVSAASSSAGAGDDAAESASGHGSANSAGNGKKGKIRGKGGRSR